MDVVDREPVDRGATYLTPSPAQRHLGLSCLGVGWDEHATAPTDVRALDCYAMVLIHRGSGWVQTARVARQAVHAPALIWLHPRVTHHYGPGRSGWSERWVLFDGLAARAYEDLGHLDRGRAVSTPADLTPVERLLDRLQQLAATPARRTGAELGATLHELVVTASTPTPTADADRELVAALVAGAGTPLTVEEHARRLRTPVTELRAVVRRVTGDAPQAVLVRARIDQAKALLAHTDLMVAQVAREVGYDDAAYFSRVFTRQAGIAPSAFRAQEQRTGPPVPPT